MSEHKTDDSKASATTTHSPSIGCGASLRRRMGGFAVLPPPITPAGNYYRNFPINNLTSSAVSTASSNGSAAKPRITNNDSQTLLKTSVISKDAQPSVVYDVSTARRLARVGKNTSG